MDIKTIIIFFAFITSLGFNIHFITQTNEVIDEAQIFADGSNHILGIINSQYQETGQVIFTTQNGERVIFIEKND